MVQLHKEDCMELERKRTALVGSTICARGMCRAEGVKPEGNAPLSFVLISEANDGLRRDWYSGEQYIERLDISGASWPQRLTFFKDHNASTDNAIGRVHDVKVADNTLIGDVTFGTGNEEQTVRRKYLEGILTDVSVSYRINAYTIKEREGEPDLVIVTDFELIEVSAVGIGFDAGAKKRGISEDEFEERLNSLEQKLK